MPSPPAFETAEASMLSYPSHAALKDRVFIPKSSVILVFVVVIVVLLIVKSKFYAIIHNNNLLCTEYKLYIDYQYSKTAAP